MTEAARPPLAGRRVLVTRATHQVSDLADRLRAAGAEPLLVPTIRIVDPPSFAALDAALGALSSYDWVVFTSANAVGPFVRRFEMLRCSEPPRRVAVIGRATQRAVAAAGFTVDLVPETGVAEALGEALLPHAAGGAFLLVRAAEARDVLPEALRAARGQVTVAEAYRNEVPSESIAALRQLFAHTGMAPDAATFTSASTARNLAALLDQAGIELPPSMVRASIGPVTSAAMRELGIPPDIEAAEPSVAALTDALSEYFSPQPR